MARPKRPHDTNQLAKFIVDAATGDADQVAADVNDGQREGGKRGGKARAEQLSPERRQEIASTAAKAKWSD